jgi:hypothetical protein
MPHPCQVDLCWGSPRCLLLLPCAFRALCCLLLLLEDDNGCC